VEVQLCWQLMVLASSYHVPFSFLSSGIANIGVGELSEAHEKNVAFYRDQIAQFAKKKGVIMNVISISGSNTRLEYLGMLSDITGGSVDLVSAEKLDFTTATTQVVLGTQYGPYYLFYYF